MTNNLPIPPQNLEAEESVLGSILLDPEGLTKIADQLTHEDFYVDKNGQIFKAMLELYEQREPIDLLSLTNKLEASKMLESVGGRSYLVSLASAIPSAANIVNYARIIRAKANLRRLIEAGHKISRLGYEEDQEVTGLLAEAEKEIFRISQIHSYQQFIPLKNVLSETFERIDELHKGQGKLRGLATGFYDLDNKLSGLQNSDLVVLAARPSMGKTSLALDIARHIAVNNKVPIGIFSLEMSKEQLADRLLCAQAGVDLWKMRTGNLSHKQDDDDFPRIGEAMAILSEAPILIDDSASANIMEMRTKARRLKMEHKIGFLVVDYLQLMEGSSRRQENRVQEISEISRNLKALARELNIPVLALSQLSRGVEQRSPQIPQLADLRESGSIEQDADVVIFIYREEYYKRETGRPHIADILIKKHRNGPTGEIELYFEENQASFKNLEKKTSDTTSQMKQ